MDAIRMAGSSTSGGFGRDTRAEGCGSLSSVLVNAEDIEAARAEVEAERGCAVTARTEGGVCPPLPCV